MEQVGNPGRNGEGSVVHKHVLFGSFSPHREHFITVINTLFADGGGLEMLLL